MTLRSPRNDTFGLNVLKIWAGGQHSSILANEVRLHRGSGRRALELSEGTGRKDDDDQTTASMNENTGDEGGRQARPNPCSPCKHHMGSDI